MASVSSNPQHPIDPEGPFVPGRLDDKDVPEAEGVELAQTNAQKPITEGSATVSGPGSGFVFDQFESADALRERSDVGDAVRLLSTGNPQTRLLTDTAPTHTPFIPEEGEALQQFSLGFRRSYEALSTEYGQLKSDLRGTRELAQAVNDAADLFNSNPADGRLAADYREAVGNYNAHYADESAGPSLGQRVESYNKGAAEVNQIVQRIPLLNQRMAAAGIDDKFHPIDPLTPPLPTIMVDIAVLPLKDGAATRIPIPNLPDLPGPRVDWWDRADE